ncbi:MAG: translation initiation factor IF-2 subunit alpha [Candidatus Thermoplasmatota archaeon]
MSRKVEYPEADEFVVCTIRSVKNFGAFVSLDEYDEREGFIHVAEIATGWVKRMSDYVREGQRVVCRVLNVDPSKGHIDLSLKRVNDHQRREKIQEWKNEQRAEKFMEIVAERMKKSMEKCYEAFGDALIEHYGSLYKAFEVAALDPEQLKKDGFKGAWVQHLAAVGQENVQLPMMKVTGTLELSSKAPKGIDVIKDALSAAEGRNIALQYLGAPRYRISVTAHDYREAEEILKRAAERAITRIAQLGGTGRFVRKEQ